MKNLFSLKGVMLLFATIFCFNTFNAFKQDTTRVTGEIPMHRELFYELNTPTYGDKPDGINGLFDGNFWGGQYQFEILQGWGSALGGAFEIRYEFPAEEDVTLTGLKAWNDFGSNPPELSTKIYCIKKEDAIGLGPWKETLLYTHAGGYQNITAANWEAVRPAYLIIRTNYPVMSELKFFGSYNSGVYQKKVADPTKGIIPFKEMVGINAFHWDYLKDWEDRVDSAKWAEKSFFYNVRHYLNWYEIESEKDHYSFDFKWNLDAMYKKLNDEGKSVVACIKELPDYIRNSYPEDQRDNENNPCYYGSDLTDPRSYADAARMWWQFAARYGTTVWDKSFLGIQREGPIWGSHGQIIGAKSGLNLVEWCEIENERNKWWKGRKAYQTGREYAAYISAVYDGHKGLLGPGHGIKNADPKMKVSMGGIADNNTDYVKGMIDWCKEFRGYKSDGTVDLPFEAVNYHSYANNGGLQYQGSKGVSPEDGNLYNIHLKWLQLCQQYNLQCFIGEIGYDHSTDPIGPQTVPVIPGFTQEQTVGNWTLRSMLIFSRAKLNKLQFFMWDNVTEDITNGAMFATSGWYQFDNGVWRLRTLAQYSKQIVKHLGEYHFTQNVSHAPEVDRYLDGSGNVRYAGWMPTSNGSKKSYSVPGNLIRSYNMRDDGKTDTLVTSSIEITEHPVLFDLIPSTPLPVEFVDVKATCSNKSTVITWQTANEKDVDLFYVQRSYNGTTWENIGSVIPAGSYYTFTAQPASGTVYYRIAEKAIGGKMSYSKVVTTNCTYTQPGGIVAYPNPTTGIVMLSSSEQITVISPTGAIIFKGKAQMINLSSYAAGIYIIKVKNQSISILKM